MGGLSGGANGRAGAVGARMGDGVLGWIEGRGGGGATGVLGATGVAETKEGRANGATTGAGAAAAAGVNTGAAG